MPRRLITSELFRNEKVAELDYAGRLFFIGLITNADDAGRLKGAAKYLKILIFPYDDISRDDIINYRKKCHDLGIAKYYSVNGKEVVSLTGWEEHQSIRSDRRKDSKLPPPDNQKSTECLPPDNQKSTECLPPDNQVSTECLHNIIEYNISKDNIYNIYSHWNTQKIIVHQKITQEMKKAINKTLKKYSEDEVIKAISNYAIIVNSDDYFFNYKWSLGEFLTRRNCVNIERFQDLELAKSNFKNDKKENKSPRPVMDAQEYDWDD
jgi:hypothetical protein